MEKGVVLARRKTHLILSKALVLATGEIAEKIALALRALQTSISWEDGFTAGYYASWAEGLANQLCPGTPLCNLLNEMISLLTVQPERKKQ